MPFPNAHMLLKGYREQCLCGNNEDDFSREMISEKLFFTLKGKLIHCLGNIFIFPFCVCPKKCSSPKQWDKKDNFRNDFYYNPVFAGICTIVKKLFSQKKQLQ